MFSNFFNRISTSFGNKNAQIDINSASSHISAAKQQLSNTADSLTAIGRNIGNALFNTVSTQGYSNNTKSTATNLIDSLISISAAAYYAISAIGISTIIALDYTAKGVEILSEAITNSAISQNTDIIPQVESNISIVPTFAPSENNAALL